VRSAERRLRNRGRPILAGPRLQRGICASCGTRNGHDNDGDAHGAQGKDRGHGNDC